MANSESLISIIDRWYQDTSKALQKRSAGRPPMGNKPKEQIVTRIDADLKRQAEKAKLILSRILEEGIKQKLNL
jgi:uncharacterized protein (DUF4415 family)